MFCSVLFPPLTLRKLSFKHAHHWGRQGFTLDAAHPLQQENFTSARSRTVKERVTLQLGHPWRLSPFGSAAVGEHHPSARPPSESITLWLSHHRRTSPFDSAALAPGWQSSESGAPPALTFQEALKGLMASGWVSGRWEEVGRLRGPQDRAHI